MRTWMKLGLMTVAVLGLGACTGDGEEEPILCPQEVAFARSSTGTCESFPTACDVPQGYIRCCGGLFGGCSSETSCVDDPSDTCAPGASADCPGICQ
ncbi:hypothetical protein D7Y13_16990 [Corallococcus praedator]|uniref:Lipoprotein n=1 Tax=Corallococcus praedator TaxID=2316724 RepID=A0ABX9QHM0_9BACT|nr:MULTISPECIES: hypothetical protein [Corallococcus]RKH35849.1 hypothetical protein D7X75_02895 [Corallococcus sp. CA031C]RKI07884.1 hypothetical protein D7Y13_16990 [Corallococcus praedator]